MNILYTQRIRIISSKKVKNKVYFILSLKKLSFNSHYSLLVISFFGGLFL